MNNNDTTPYTPTEDEVRGGYAGMIDVCGCWYPDGEREAAFDRFIAQVRNDASAKADRRIRAALDVLDGRFQPTDRIGDLHGAMARALKGEL